ncbi:mitochondrial enolase superfamily member 1 [Linepithema humile]|uniref:mitochondrial enolase superfamily member 1 n=1 Tax=Linepithema humile TaxID=83485 RepID=UPI0006239263|nr:PREDICTED: mitochondrial enolase superfamily member 1-like [Linepithema humile]
MIEATLTSCDIYDIRFLTSKNLDGSDAMHTSPNYSCAYVVIKTNTGHEGYAPSFTLGKGTDILVLAIKTIFDIIKNRTTTYIYNNFAEIWKNLACHPQLRWLGPEKGIIHTATGAIVNALWDLWARLENKPLWKLLVDMSPKQLASTIDFKYISDAINEEEVIEMLEKNMPRKAELEADLRENGYPAYTTQVGWLGYSDEKIEKLCKEYMDLGFTAFKVKVGKDINDDIRRCAMVRNTIGDENQLMMDANQFWETDTAIKNMKLLAPFKPIWIEEPTNPDDEYGHIEVQVALKKLGIGLATGEMFENRLKFKSFLNFRIMDYCQIDASRVGGINEILSIYFMAKRYKIPVCPHAGGVGLCEMVQHLQMWDYICLSQTKENRMIEYVDQQHEHFENPVCIKNACYMPPTLPGYSTKIKDECIVEYGYPRGTKWQELRRFMLPTIPYDQLVDSIFDNSDYMELYNSPYTSDGSDSDDSDDPDRQRSRPIVKYSLEYLRA